MKNVTSHRQQLIDLLDDRRNAILDYGCGNGDFINANSKPKKVLAVDSDESMLSNVKRRFLINGDGAVTTKLALSPAELQGKFDKVICHNVLECVDNKLDFINSFRTLITENSVFLLFHHDFDSAILGLLTYVEKSFIQLRRPGQY